MTDGSHLVVTDNRANKLHFYVIDQDGNTLELMWDKPSESWARDAEGHQAMVFGEPLDLGELLAELDQ